MCVCTHTHIYELVCCTPETNIVNELCFNLKKKVHTMKCYSAIKKNKIVPFAEMWMELKMVIQSEVSQKKKN